MCQNITPVYPQISCILNPHLWELALFCHNTRRDADAGHEQSTLCKSTLYRHGDSLCSLYNRRNASISVSRGN
jgi:hypothetical protein